MLPALDADFDVAALFPKRCLRRYRGAAPLHVHRGLANDRKQRQAALEPFHPRGSWNSGRSYGGRKSALRCQVVGFIQSIVVVR